jgi:D-alanyl-D-alanine carboxypeptidase (penicillin-binding protein 5/6)
VTYRQPADNHRTYVPAVKWPQQRQAALVLGNNRPKASPDEQPVPIASVTQVMTAYLVLKHYPLSRAQDGFTATITPATGISTIAAPAATGDPLLLAPARAAAQS